MIPDELKNKNIKLFIAMPMFGGMLSEPTFRSVLALQRWCDSNGIEIGIKTATNESLVSRARNTLVSMFLDDISFNATHLLFIDSDIGFRPLNVERLIRYDQEVCCGVYPRKVIHWDQVIKTVRENPLIDEKTLMSKSLGYNLNFDDPNNVILNNGFCEVKEAATGLMLIKRSVFEIMKNKFPQRKYRSDQLINQKNYSSENCYDFFAVGKIGPDQSERYLSEDYYFSNLWRECGGKIYADITQPLTHFGSISYNGNVCDMFEEKKAD